MAQPNRLRNIATIGFLFASLPALALDPNRAVTQYAHRSWTVEDGLPQDSVQTIAQTHDGYLWFGTPNGLVRFDGARLAVFDPGNVPELEASNITSLRCDRTGTLWIGTARGVVTYRDGRFRSIGNAEQLLRIFAIREGVEPGTMWFGSSTTGLFRYVNGRLSHEREAPPNAYALSMQRGALLIGASDGLYRYVDGKSTRLSGIEGPIYAIANGPRGEIWAAGQGIWRHDGTRADRPIPQLNGEEVWALSLDRQGSLWVGTRTGLWRYAAGGLARLGESEGLSHKYVDSIFEDSEGALWVGTHLGGVNQFYDGFFLPYRRSEGLSDDTTWTIAEDHKGTMWAGTEEGGLNRFHAGKWSSVAGSTGLRQGVISSLAAATGGGMWVGTYGNGLHLLTNDGVRVYTKRDGLPDDAVLALLVDRHGALWIGTATAVTRMAEGRFTTYTKKDGLPSGEVIYLSEDRDGRIWVANGAGSGAVVLEGSRFTTMPRGQRLPSEQAICILADRRGDVWFGTRSGVFRLHSGGLFHYTAKHGMPRGIVTQIFEDDRGSLWMATALGVLRVRRDELDAVMSGRARNVAAVLYSVDDGLPSPEVSAGVYPGAWQRTDGTIWFATARGIAVLDPRVAPPALQARPLVEGVRINATTVSHTQPIIMGAAHDRLEFVYTFPTFTAPRRLRFRYRLEGYDDRWVDAADRRVAEYTNLPPGRYRFFVEASDDGRRWLTSPRIVEVTRLPAVYQTWWFAALCLVATVCLILLVHHRRIRIVRLRHEAIDDERRRMAMEFHDTLAQGLTGALLQIEGAVGHAGNPVRLTEHLQTGKDLIRSTMAEARRVMVNLRSESLDTNDLAAAFTSMMGTMTRGLPMQGSVRVIGRPRRLRDPGVENHLLRIGQEAITNALRHSNAKHVLLTIEFQSREVILAVRDDGRGSGRFTLDELSASSHGLRGMRERAEQIHAKLTARTIAGGGFEIVVVVTA